MEKRSLLPEEGGQKDKRTFEGFEKSRVSESGVSPLPLQI